MSLPHAVGRMLLISWLLLVSVVTAQEPAGIVAKGTKWATPYYVIDSDKPGPTDRKSTRLNSSHRT